MKRVPITILVFILTAGLLIAGCSSPPTPEGSAQGPEVGKLAPDLQLLNPEGQSVSLSDSRGKPILMNFWASWCVPCLIEMPYIQEIYDEWTDKGLEVLAINVGESPSHVKEFLQSQGLHLPVLLDTNEEVALKYNVRGFPTTFFVDKDGIIQIIKVGPFLSKAEIETSLNKIVP